MAYIDRTENTSITAGPTRAAHPETAPDAASERFFELDDQHQSSPTRQPELEFQFPRIFRSFLAGAWTSHIGSFLQVTYNMQDDHFSADNTDIRYANRQLCPARNWFMA